MRGHRVGRRTLWVDHSPKGVEKTLHSAKCEDKRVGLLDGQIASGQVEARGEGSVFLPEGQNSSKEVGGKTEGSDS